MLKGRRAKTGLKCFLKYNKNARISFNRFINLLDLEAIELRNKFFQNIKALVRKSCYSKQWTAGELILREEG